jgi:valyl-tRNA synthetase
VLVTGFDIIFFWVARMTMMAGALMSDREGSGIPWIPFRDVYIHGLVRDENNRKMSKSAGNGIDPLLLIERYGADALRFALVREVAGAGQDIRLDYDRKSDTSATVEASRNFANKLWNATRFALMNLGGETPASLGAPDRAALKLPDRWILSRLARVNRETAERYGIYGLGEAAKGLYEFAWNEVCDWYLELIKRRLNPGENPGTEALADQRTARQVLAKVLAELLVLLHPLMPHLSEELWHGLTGEPEGTFLALQPWPAVDEMALDDALEASFSGVIGLIRIGRNLRAVRGMKPSEKIGQVGIATENDGIRQVISIASDDFKSLIKADSIGIITGSPEYKSIVGISGTSQVHVEVPESDVPALRARLDKDLAKAEKEIKGLAGRLANPNFAAKAPPEVVAECRANLAEAEMQAELARKRLADLG